MNPLIISFNSKAVFNSVLSMDSGSQLDGHSNNNHHSNGHGSGARSKMANTTPTQVISNLLYELRNPLTSVNLSMEMLGSMMQDNDQKVCLDIITGNMARLNDMINVLIKQQQAVEEEKEDHSIQQIMDEVLEMNAEKIMLKKIVVSKHYTAPDHKVVLNKQKMKIAMTNIILNAINAIPSENGELKLVTRFMNGKYLIEIEDNGIGISEENLKNIFKEYFINMPALTGTGLSATLDILLANHAGVAVQSEEGKGTRFIFSFDGVQQPGVILDNATIPDMA